jgi:hypothetical protein
MFSGVFMTIKSTCELLDSCCFFIYEMKVESIAHRFKERYCRSCKEACAIYMVYSAFGTGAIPFDLYPNEYDRALAILSKKPQ